MTDQLSLDFSASTAERHRRARKAAERADAKPLALFTEPPNIDVHLHSALEAVASVTGDPDRAVRFLQGLVGPVRILKTRRFAFPAEALDRLAWLRPPAQVTLDAAATAVARAIWADKLGLRPLQVRRDGRRLVASSPRWPAGLRVVDAPWTTIAVLTRAGIPLDVDARARRLMLDKLGDAGTHVAKAGLAGSAVSIQASRPDLLEALELPGLSFAGEPSAGMYRMPLLSAECLLTMPQISKSPELEAEIRRVTRRVRPLKTTSAFPWTLYPFQARDAARALRILETTGGVLLAGDMGSGKCLPVDAPVLTPTGWQPIGTLAPGDHVIGTDGQTHQVSGVYPQGEKNVHDVLLTDQTIVTCSNEQLWHVQSLAQAHAGQPGETLTLEAISNAMRDDHTLFRVPRIRPVEFRDQPTPAPSSASSQADPRRTGAPDECIPSSVLTGTRSTRETALRRLISEPTGHSGLLESSSRRLCEDAAFLARTLGGHATIEQRPGSTTTWQATITLPEAGSETETSHPEGFPPVGPLDRTIVSVTPNGRRDTVCISVDAPDCMYLTTGLVPVHNTTVSLALIETLEASPLLVVAPLSAFSTWARQLTELDKTFYLATDAPKVVWKTLEEGNFDAVVITYDRLHAFSEIIERMGFRAIVADELQRIRTPGSRRSRAIRALASSVPLRIGLSGTPLTNTIADLLPMGAFLVPGEWRPRAHAKDLADMYPGDPIESIAEHLGSMMVRRRMEDTGATLPKRNDHRVFIELTPEQRRALADLEEEAQRAKEEGAFEDGSSRMHAFARLQKMRQIVNSPASAGIAGPNPKIRATLDIVDDFLAMGRKGVVFCADRATFRELGAEFTKARIGWVGIWGATPAHERIENERRFHQDPDVKIVLCTIQAGSESWSASPTATWLVSTSYMYAPATLAQMEARVYRMNSDPDGPDVEIMYVHASVPGGSLDDRMVQILEQKRQLFAQVVDRTDHIDSTTVHYSMGDLVYLLTGERDEKLDRHAQDAKAASQREQDRKDHAKSTLYRNKGRNRKDASLERDTGETTATWEEYSANVDEVDLLLDTDDLATGISADENDATFDAEDGD